MNPKMVLGGGVVLLLAGALAGYLYGVDSTVTRPTTRVSTTTTTFTTTLTATSPSPDIHEQVANAFANHMLVISSRNAYAIVGQYEKNATVTWTGKASGLQGFYNGTKIIFILMNASFISRAGSLSIGNVTHTMVDISKDSAVVNSSFDIFGQNYYIGLPYGYLASFNYAVSAQDSYAYSSTLGAWLISTETWNFLSFNGQQPR
jgi:hypothetical protein